MKAILLGDKVRWMAAVTVALGVVTSVAWLFRMPPEVGALPKPEPRPAVQMARTAATDRVLREETEIRDLRPLFLPTEFNVTLPEPRREAGRTFLDNETLKLGFSESELSLVRDLPPFVTLGGKSAEEARGTDLLAAELDGAGAVGFGREAVPKTEFKARGGFVEIFSSADGRRVLEEELPPDARPPGEKPWEPLEILAAVDAAGLAAPLIVTTSSRVEEVDVHVRNFLSQRFRVGDRLAPGFYRIVVGP